MNIRLLHFAIIFSFLNTMLAESGTSMKVLGDSQIKMALSEIESGNYRDGLRFLRLGVHNSPGNLEGRKVLAEFYEVALTRPDTASSLMIEGLELGGIEDLDYLKKTLRTLLRHQMDVEIQEIADQYLPATPDDSEINRTLAFGAANANFLRGEYDKADDYLNDYNLQESVEGLLLSSQISWDCGNQLQAITIMEGSLSEFPNSEALLMQLSRYNRELGNLEEAKRYAILRIASDPLSYAARIELLYLHEKSGDLAGSERVTKELIEQFDDNNDAMKQLANFAADTGNSELAEKTYDIAVEQSFEMDVFALLLLESFITNKDYLAAQSLADSFYEDNPEWLAERWSIFSALRAVISSAHNGSGKGNPAYLNDFLSDPSNKPQTYLAVARRFTANNCDKEAFEVLSVANKEHPSNQKVTTEFIQCCLKLERLEEATPSLKRLLAMRRPDKDLLSEALLLLKDAPSVSADKKALILEIEATLQPSES